MKSNIATIIFITATTTDTATTTATATTTTATTNAEMPHTTKNQKYSDTSNTTICDTEDVHMTQTLHGGSLLNVCEILLISRKQ